ncbi:MAG TPA: prolyl oligopeptidase family serine peptidase [Aggregatilineales bacterium]|nr:prolyl oligopeptidase family serine peptidase [Aggregatilineales bacterium]
MQKRHEEGNVWKRTSSRVYFGHQDMDFYFRWILGIQAHDGSSAGECFYTASHIEDGDPLSWQIAWRELAERVEARAEDSLRNRHRVSAREGYLRATTYFRAPVSLMSPRNPDFMKLVGKFQTCFRRAAALFDLPFEPLEIAFEGQALPAYFLKVAASGARRKTLIMIGGGETFVEDLYFYIGPAARRRGYNVLLVDLPGQGITPASGLYFRTDTDVPMKVIVDYLLTRPDVDPDRLAVYGISGGGLMVPRALTVEKRIKACIANPPYYDSARVNAATRSMRAGGLDAIATSFWEQLCWRSTGQCDLGKIDRAEAAKTQGRNCYDPHQVMCPTLCLAGAGELPDWIDQAREFYEMLPTSTKAFHLLTAEDGAEGHCNFDNLALMSQIVFDWLDEVFDR